MNKDQPANFNLVLLACCESEVKDGVTSSLEPIPTPDPSPLDNSVYNFNAILDAEGEA